MIDEAIATHFHWDRFDHWQFNHKRQRLLARASLRRSRRDSRPTISETIPNSGYLGIEYEASNLGQLSAIKFAPSCTCQPLLRYVDASICMKFFYFLQISQDRKYEQTFPLNFEWVVLVICSQVLRFVFTCIHLYSFMTRCFRVPNRLFSFPLHWSDRNWAILLFE